MDTINRTQRATDCGIGDAPAAQRRTVRSLICSSCDRAVCQRRVPYSREQCRRNSAASIGWAGGMSRAILCAVSVSYVAAI